MNLKKWEKLKTKRDKIEKQMQDAYLEGGGCTSKCPNCNLWEHQGITILNEDLTNGMTRRTCDNCGHVCFSIFTPAGFITIENYGISEDDEEPESILLQ